MSAGGKPRGLALEGRNGEIWRGVTIYRKTEEALAVEHGISQQRVHQIVESVRKQIPDTDLDFARRESIEFYAEMTRRAIEIVDLTPAPVTVGKDGNVLREPDTGEVVRDYSGRLNAMQVAMKADAERRKMLGLDAAQKVEQSGSMKIEIVGVDPDDLS